MLNYISWKGGIASDYFFWLCDKVGYQDDYDGLMRFLFDTEFYWVIPMDRSRAIDGLDLRKEFMEESDVRGDWDDGNPCSILEMMVALAIRVEESVLGDPDICLFWRMIDHLGLSGIENEDELRERVDDMLERRISRNGSGGLFPLRGYVRRDQRRVDIWEQCMGWINENLG